MPARWNTLSGMVRALAMRIKASLTDRIGRLVTPQLTEDKLEKDRRHVEHA